MKIFTLELTAQERDTLMAALYYAKHEYFESSAYRVVDTNPDLAAKYLKSAKDTDELHTKVACTKASQ